MKSYLCLYMKYLFRFQLVFISKKGKPFNSHGWAERLLLSVLLSIFSFDLLQSKEEENYSYDCSQVVVFVISFRFCAFNR
jgi:hypothetical protein